MMHYRYFPHKELFCMASNTNLNFMRLSISSTLHEEEKKKKSPNTKKVSSPVMGEREDLSTKVAQSVLLDEGF